MIRHYIELNTKDRVASNLPPACIACANSCAHESQKVQCKMDGEWRRSGRLENSKGSVYLCSDNNNDLKSSRVFKEKLAARLELLDGLTKLKDEIQDEATSSLKRVLHNLTSLNAHCIQEIYAFIPQDQLAGAKQVSQIQTILDHINEDKSGAAQLFARILKNNSLMKVEFSVFNKLYDPQPRLDRREYSVRSVVLNVLHVFFPDFTDKEVIVKVEACDLRVYLDYESITAALVHLVENSSKYVLPKTDVKVRFEYDDRQLRIIFEMISIKIEDDETERIFEEGYSGRLVQKLHKAGKGIGLYIVKQILNMNQGSLQVLRNGEIPSSAVQMGIPFEHNTFIMSLPILNR